MNAPGERHSRAQIWVVVALFFAPLALAFLLYYGAGGWHPSGSTNHGELISPARPLPSVALPTPDGAALPPETWHGKWTLVHVGDGRCDGRCRAALTLTRQTRLALNADMTRVQRIFLATAACCDRKYFAAEQRDLLVALADNAAGAQLLATFPDAPPATDGYIYIVDPLGNLMMRHAPESGPAKGLLEDLRKLLKLSHIG
ncbi:MAG TPA: hypothetical protein VJS12_15950 [Steroidobacteraceae bacterium]|nr:hypothetical protein [Steroidobacteraceae bacterium]